MLLVQNDLSDGFGGEIVIHQARPCGSWMCCVPFTFMLFTFEQCTVRHQSESLENGERQGCRHIFNMIYTSWSATQVQPLDNKQAQTSLVQVLFTDTVMVARSQPMWCSPCSAGVCALVGLSAIVTLLCINLTMSVTDSYLTAMQHMHA